MTKLRASNPGPEVTEFLDFISQGKRGITRPKAGAAEEEEAAV